MKNGSDLEKPVLGETADKNTNHTATISKNDKYVIHCTSWIGVILRKDLT